LSKNWRPKDLRGTKHLLDEHRAIERARIAKNVADSWCPPYEPGWRFSADWVFDVQYCALLGDTLQQIAAALDKTELAVIRALNETPKLNPYRLALDEFEIPDDRWWGRGSSGGKDYREASEGPGRVTVCGSNYDVEEEEDFSPYDAIVRYKNDDGGWKCKRRATADEEDTLGLYTESDLVEKMADAVKAWAGMTAPPKAADPTVEILIKTYLANGGEVHTRDAYQTTPRSKIRFKLRLHPAWAGGTGIPPELRNKKRLFRVRPKTGSKQCSNTA
jgi:hypothetical protein